MSNYNDCLEVMTNGKFMQLALIRRAMKRFVTSQ